MTDALWIAETSAVRKLPGLPGSVRLAFLALSRISKGRLTVRLASGQVFIFDKGNPGPVAEIHVFDNSLAGRVLLRGDIGFADAYMDGQFDTPDLTAVLEYFAINFESAGKLGRGSPVSNALMKIVDTFTRGNSRKGAKKNILAHYDLGNEFYETWLDPTMTYSSAIFDGAENMIEAQEKKYSAIAAKIEANPDSHILEIGSGWGGFAEHAAKAYGAKVTTITISDAQHAYASKRIYEAGLNERVKVELCDYRDVDGQYDGIASIEMFEAVGEAYWSGYFNKVADCLKSGKRAALQIITIDDDLYEGYRKRVDFIQKYIFPGGMLPSQSALEREIRKAGLEYESAHMFGQSYADTLKIWASNFRQAWPDIEDLGFDLKFRKLWAYYLSYCEAGFKTGRTDVGQFVIRKA